MIHKREIKYIIKSDTIKVNYFFGNFFCYPELNLTYHIKIKQTVISE